MRNMIPFAELAAVLRGGEKEGNLALLRAYFDASHSGPSKGIYAVGGFVGHERDWIAAEAKWKEGLETFRLEEFHLAEIIPTLGQEMGRLCILHFSKIMGRSALRGIGASCDVEHWRGRNTGYDNPYHFCFSMALNVLREEVELELDGESIALVVDDDFRPHDLAQNIFAAYQKDRDGIFASLTFGNRRRFLPIQCADLAVGALRREWLEGLVSNNKKAIREFFGALGPKARFMHFSAEMERLASEALARQTQSDA